MTTANTKTERLLVPPVADPWDKSLPDANSCFDLPFPCDTGVEEEVPPPPPPPPAHSPHPRAYGIDQTIHLLNQLPKGNMDLVVKVVKKTLASLDVDVGNILSDAKGKQAATRARIAFLEEEIRRLEGTVHEKQTEVKALRDTEERVASVMTDLLSKSASMEAILALSSCDEKTERSMKKTSRRQRAVVVGKRQPGQPLLLFLPAVWLWRAWRRQMRRLLEAVTIRPPHYVKPAVVKSSAKK